MRPKPKQFLLPAIIFLAIVLVALAVRLWPRTVPFDQCSDLYKQYANVEGIDATFIKDYKVNDTVFVDVTLLETKDTALWDSLCKDFGIALFSMYPKEYREIMSIEHSFGQQVIKDTIVLENDSLYKENLIIFSHINMSMCIFHKINDSQYDAIVNEKHKEITF